MTRAIPAAVALAVAALAALPAERPARIELTAAGGALKVVNSRDEAAILTAANMAPGDEARGYVTVANRGKRPLRMVLRSSRPRGSLAEVLAVTVDRAPGRVLASGSLGEIAGCHDLGTMAPGESRTYRFTATFPRASGNGYARAAASVDERWMPGGCVPRPRLIVARRAVVRGRRARLRVRCVGAPGTRCTGTLTIKRPRARVRVRLAAGRRRTLRLRVSGRRLRVVVRGSMIPSRRTISVTTRASR